MKRNLSLSVGGIGTKFRFKPVVIEKLSMPINLASSFLRFHHWDQLHGKESLRIQGKLIPLVAGKAHQVGAVRNLASAAKVAENTQVPPWSHKLVQVQSSNWHPTQKQGIVTGSVRFMDQTDLHPVRNAIANFDQQGAKVAVLNTTSEPILIPAGTEFGQVEWLQNDQAPECHPFRIAALQNLPNSPNEKGEDREVSGGNSIPDWQQGSTSPQNKAQRITFLLEYFKLKDSPTLQTEGHLARALALLLKYWHVFSWDGSFGTCRLLEHEIFTTKGLPISQKLRPINPNLEARLREQIDEWLAKDVIEPSKSPWNFPLVAVPKKNGKIRWCVDYRALNARTEKDAHPIGSVESNLSSLAGSSIFSALDNAGAFHVVPLAAEAKEKTAFSTSWGHWHFKSMPFGLANGPATYSRLVQLVLQGIPSSMALAYLDDILCHSSTFDGHLESLSKVFAAYSAAGLKLQPAKCSFFKDRTKYLGHIVSAEGLMPDPDYVQVVSDWPIPRNRTQVRAFLGKAGYYRKYIKDYAAIARPLTDVLQADTFPDLKDKDPIPISAEMKQSFETLKTALLQEPILAFPDFSKDAKPFILDTDWSQSNGAIGCCLMQEQNGHERVIAYAAKRLDSTQLNYAPTKGELFAAMFGMKHFEYFLAGKKFLLRTDHSSLQYIKTMTPPSLVEARWLECVTKFDFDVQYRKGSQHGNADALSRAEHLEAAVNALRPILDDTSEDPPLDSLREWMKQGRLPSPDEVHHADPQLRFILKHWEHLKIVDESVVIDHPSKPQRRVVSQELFVKLATRAHVELGHRGAQAVCKYLTPRYFAYQSRILVTSVVASCNPCQTKTKPSSTGNRSHFHRTQAGQPWQRLSIDFVGPLPVAKAGYKYLLTVKDTFTGYLEAIPTRDMLASTVAKALNTQIFSRFGFPEAIHTDQGTNFTSQLLTDTCVALGIRLTHTPPYNQRSNPVERAHRDLQAALTALCSNRPHSWLEHLPAALFAQRVAVSSVTGFSPFYLIFGRQPRCALDLSHPSPSAAFFESDIVRDAARPWRAALHQARAQAARQLCFEQQLYGRPMHQFAKGDLVWLFKPKTKAKGKFEIWWTGPWTIVHRKNLVTYELRSVETDPSLQITCTAVVDRLRPYHVSQGCSTEALPDTAVDPWYEQACLDLDQLQIGPTQQPRQRNRHDSASSQSSTDSLPENDASFQAETPPVKLVETQTAPPSDPKVVPEPSQDTVQSERTHSHPSLPETPVPPSYLSEHTTASSRPPTPPSLSEFLTHDEPDPEPDDQNWLTSTTTIPDFLVPTSATKQPSKIPRMKKRLQSHIPSPPPANPLPQSERAKRYVARSSKVT